MQHTQHDRLAQQLCSLLDGLISLQAELGVDVNGDSELAREANAAFQGLTNVSAGTLFTNGEAALTS